MKHVATAPLQAVLALLALVGSASAGAVQPGQPAPAFESAALTGGAPIRLADSLGKVVYLDFWASWCGPCRLSLPWMERLSQDYGARGLVVIAVNVDEKTADGRAFLQRFPVDFAVAVDPRGDVASLYDVQDMPSSYLIDRRGVVRAVHRGFNPQAARSVRDEALALLAEPQP